MDPTYLQRFLSDSARNATRSEIRELLKLIARPEIISLAGGLPPPEAFPIADVAEILPATIRRYGAAALQYGPTEGDVGLKEQLLQLMVAAEGEAFARLTPEHLLITSASQQALDLCSRIFVSRDDAVVVGLPDYLGALGAFTACGAKLTGVPQDDQGLRVDLLEQRLVDLRRGGVKPKLLYTVPDFGNPSGVTLTRRRREELLSVAREFDLLVLEDSPYRQLRYVGEPQPTLHSLDRDGRVISMFTFSKILFPGLRLGWVVADPEIIARLVVAKQPVDLCTSGLSQLVAREYLKSGRLPQQLTRIRELYAMKRDVMLRALETHMDPDWGVSWTRPEGGLFLWVRLPATMSARKLLERAVRDHHVAFVVGDAFHCDGSGTNTLRLNFSYPGPEQLEQGIERLARCIGSMVEAAPSVDEAATQSAPALLVDGEHALMQLSWNLGLTEVVE